MRKTIIMIISIILIVGLNFCLLNKNIYLNRFLKDIYYVLFITPYNYFRDQKDLYDKYLKIINENEELKISSLRYIEFEKENRELKSLLELKSSLSDYELINATIINYNLDFDSYTLDKGSKDGIMDNMAVINHMGLIGYIKETGLRTSTVLLFKGIDDIKISVKIKVGNEFAYGLITKYNNDGTYLIDGVSKEYDIKKGDSVISTGMTDPIPAGINLGVVKQVRSDNFDLTNEIIMESVTNYFSSSYVSVLKRTV